jgi:hypothetical protein
VTYAPFFSYLCALVELYLRSGTFHYLTGTPITNPLILHAQKKTFRGGRSGCENREQNLEGKVGREE